MKNQKTRKAADLNSRLSDYDHSVGSRKTFDLREKLANWPVYAAVAGSALAMASNAAANTIYYSGVKDVKVFGVPGNGESAVGTFLNLDGLGDNAALLMNSKRGQLGGCPPGVSITAGFCSTGRPLAYTGGKHLAFLGRGTKGSPSFIAASSGFARRFRAGSFIGHTGERSQPGAEALLRDSMSSRESGNFVPNQTGFLGVELGPDEWGWIRLELFTNANGAVDEVEAIDWAFNLEGTIDAGQESNTEVPTTTPEPSTAAMALLAAGAAGVLALRRRRARQAPVE